MIEPDAIALSAKPRWRVLVWTAVITGPLVLILAWLGYQWYWDRDFRAAIEQTDRLDPGWRLAELEAAYTIEKSKTDAVQAALFKKLAEHYRKRDALRLVVSYRKKFLDSLHAEDIEARRRGQVERVHMVRGPRDSGPSAHRLRFGHVR